MLEFTIIKKSAKGLRKSSTIFLGINPRLSKINIRDSKELQTIKIATIRLIMVASLASCAFCLSVFPL